MEPTGSASLAIAMARNLTIPGECLADRPETLARGVVAERSRDPGFVGGARGNAERGGGFVVACQVGVEHRGVVRRDRALYAGADELRQRMLVERGDDAGAEVRERADVEDGAAA